MYYDDFYETRERATAVVRRDGLLLLVRDRGFRQFSLPGGGLRPNESPEEAVSRELAEETGLRAITVESLPGCQTSDAYNTYLVFQIEAEGVLRINAEELSEAHWWDGRTSVPLFGYVKHVLELLHWPK